MPDPPKPTDLYSPEDLAIYCDAIMAVGPIEAAREQLDMSGSAARSLMKRDPYWHGRYLEAKDEWSRGLGDRLDEEATHRATDGGSDRMLEVQLATHSPAHAHLRRDRQRMDHIHSGLVVTLPAQDVLDGMSVEEKRELLAALRRLGGDVIEAGTPPRELAP